MFPFLCENWLPSLERISVTRLCECCKRSAGDVPSALLQCAGCKCAFYCGSGCQKADWPEHRKECRAVVKAKNALEVERRALEHREPDSFSFELVPESYFHTHVGDFWGLVETRPYCRAVIKLERSLVELGSQTALKWAVKCCLHLLRLNSSDNTGRREVIVHYLLRLGLDEECFNFIFWWQSVWGRQAANEEEEEDRRWEEIGGDITRIVEFDHTDPYVLGDTDMSHCVALTKVAFQLWDEWLQLDESMLAVLGATHARLGCDSPASLVTDKNIWRLIRTQLMMITCRSFTMDPLRSLPHECRRRAMIQAEMLLDVVDRRNSRIWRALVNPTPLLSHREPHYSSEGSAAEAYAQVRDSLPYWKASHRAMRWLVEHVGSEEPLYEVASMHDSYS